MIPSDTLREIVNYVWNHTPHIKVTHEEIRDILRIAEPFMSDASETAAVRQESDR